MEPQNQPAMVRPWLLIVFLIVILAAGGYWGWQYWTKTKTPTVAPTTVTSTTDLKTYTNSTYNFSFKYPSDWEAKEVTVGGVYSLSIGYRPIAMKEDYSGFVYISKEKLADAITREKDSFNTNSTFDGQSITTFGGTSATKLSFTNNTDKTLKPVIYLIEKDTNLFIITGEGNSLDKSINSKVSTILSSFKFTTPISTVSTADWKTYTNTDYNYSIKYPSTWTVDLASKDSRGKTLATFLAPGMNNAPHDKTVVIQVSLTTNVSRVDSADYIKRNGNRIISTSPVIVGGVSTDKFIVNVNNGYEVLVYVEKNSETYSLGLRNTAPSDKEYIDNFNLMLSTFQFSK